MNEQDWLASESAGELIDELNQRDAASRRKFRLVACACARIVWHLIPPVGQRAVETAERHADGLATNEELEVAQSEALDAIEHDPYEESDPKWLALNAASFASWTDVRHNHGHAEGAIYVVRDVPQALVREALSVNHETAQAVAREAELLQCRLCRDVMGNPFRRSKIDAPWLRWNNRTVVTIAKEIYADRAFDRLPILADALEEAGCSDVLILTHCREFGEHVRGCWVVDLVLGKE